ncbi:unnamed protein product [Callosobruchus maculatus]|uniref:Receptor expression-enhancing protein n=1 Tax=Callosobruchus maculatus TaxID=64391 RepID=A0A653D3R4_CALMS|nr:unnamed protein product [Callosobruchus maculatus]
MPLVHMVLYPLFRLLFGTLYPAYASYKAVRSKGGREYVKWMMYWIVFALFTCIETFTDIFLSWFPFYYEIKIIFVIWLLSPATKGSSILYRKFVHPMLSSKEQEIDEYISKAKEQSYKQVLDLGSKGVTALMQTALKSINQIPPALVSSMSESALSSHADRVDAVCTVKRSVTADQVHDLTMYSDEDTPMTEVEPEPVKEKVTKRGSRAKPAARKTTRKTRGGGGIVNQLKKSYSLSDLTDPCHEEQGDVTDLLITDPRLVRRKQRSPHRSSSTSLYFSEVDVRADRLSATAGVIQSTEDISSGYSSGEGLPRLLVKEPHLQRTGSVTRSSSRNARVTRSVSGASGATGRKGPAATSDDSDENEVFDTNIVFQDEATKKVEEKAADSSSSEAEFVDTIDSLHATLFEGLKQSNKDTETQVLTACAEKRDSDDTQYCSLTDNPPSSTPLEIAKELEEKISDLKDNLSITQISKDVDTFSSFLKNLIDTKNLESAPLEPVAKHSESDDAKQCEPSEARGGKYNKKTAPAPPISESPIKATLVLKPGVVKTLAHDKESPCKEIFVQSPKSKKRSLVNRSPSSLSSSSSNSSKTKHSLSKLIKLPKKIGFWNRDQLTPPKTKEHRFSWHNLLGHDLRPLSASKMQSKSDNHLAPTAECQKLLHANSKSGSQLSIRSLTESPLAHRRLKIIRRYVDEDID